MYREMKLSKFWSIIVKINKFKAFFFFWLTKIGAFMAIFYPRAGRRSDIGSGRSSQIVQGVNPTKDAHQQLAVEVTRTQAWQAGPQAPYHWTNQRVR